VLDAGVLFVGVALRVPAAVGLGDIPASRRPGAGRGGPVAFLGYTSCVGISAMKEIFVFHIELDNISPAIWRRLEVRAEGTFWHLHCAVQDAIPWDDKHLHEFQFPSGDVETQIGLPGQDEFADKPVLASWETPLRDWFTGVPAQCVYVYDFGDDWIHRVTLEAHRPAEPGGRYPRCTGGERKGPPEDVGGPYGYLEFLAAMANPRHKNHRMYKEWIGGAWHPEDFRPGDVEFCRPSRRLRQAGLG
jgi:hypothetical protein